MVSHPVVMYDSELLAYCINSLHRYIGSEYIVKVFSIEALSKVGIEYNNKVYKLLNDIDINSDLRAYYGNNLIDELYERSMRRHPIWKSYYEYKYLFNDKLSGEEKDKLNDEEKDNLNGEEKVFKYFKGLIDYMKLIDKFILNKEIYDQLSDDRNISEQVKEAAGFLNEFCEENHIDYNFTILLSSNTFAANFKADEVYIQFGNLPSREKRNYATYEFLKGKTANSKSKRFFYLYSKEKFSLEIMGKFKDKLMDRINEIEAKNQKSKAKKKLRV